MPMHAAFDRWWNGISLRAKITGVTVLLLTFGLTVAGAGTMSVLRSYLLQQADQQISAAYEKLDGSIDVTAIQAFGEGERFNPFYLAAVDSDGTIIADNFDDAQEALLPNTSSLTYDRAAELNGEAVTLYNASRSAQWRVIAYPAKVAGEEMSSEELLVTVLGFCAADSIAD